MRTVRIIGAVVGVACALAPAAPAFAETPTASAWWNAATVSGSSLPFPLTPEGNLHLGVAPSGALAFGAVRYGGIGSPGDALLKLKVAPNSTAGTPLVLACPISHPTWKAGGNQPWNSAPTYSCAGQGVTGILSADGLTMSFQLDARLQTVTFGYDLALAPDPASTVPFSVDFIKPDDASLSVNALGGQPPIAAQPPPVATAPDPVPPAVTYPTEVPSVPNSSPATVIAGGPQTPLPPTVAAPPMATRTAAKDTHRNSPRARALAAFLLLDLAAYFAWTTRQRKREPALIGGRAARSTVSP